MKLRSQDSQEVGGFINKNGQNNRNYNGQQPAECQNKTTRHASAKVIRASQAGTFHR